MSLSQLSNLSEEIKLQRHIMRISNLILSPVITIWGGSSQLCNRMNNEISGRRKKEVLEDMKKLEKLVTLGK